MDSTQIWLSALAIICTCLGWFARELHSTLKQTQRDLAQLEIKMSADYIRFDRLTEALSPILESLREIKQSLKDKVDKP